MTIKIFNFHSFILYTKIAISFHKLYWENHFNQRGYFEHKINETDTFNHSKRGDNLLYLDQEEQAVGW